MSKRSLMLSLKHIRRFTSIMTSSDGLHLFKTAMQLVYGSLDNLSEHSAHNWTPPDVPGAGGHRGRYLWTDAFGVINFLTLSKETSSAVYLTLAKRLASTVHDVLGRTRDGNSRLPLATDAEPLKGGLRIGKVNAHGSDGDGQYHHYLTLWMFALNRLTLATGEQRYNDLAIQLATAIHPYFVFPAGNGNGKRMVWKISTDMRHVLVPSEGHLDAATGFVVYRLLQNTRTLLRMEVSSTAWPSERNSRLSANHASQRQAEGEQRPSRPWDGTMDVPLLPERGLG